jgi:hypothetical protein
MRAAILGVIGLVCVVTAAQGQLDGRLPAPFSHHLWTVPGVINNGLTTVFLCTNASSSTITVGVEVFGDAGTSNNDPAVTAIAIAPSVTRIFITKPILSFDYNAALGVGIVHHGSARILATGKGVICTALLATSAGTTPTTLGNLTIVKKTKQKGD